MCLAQGPQRSDAGEARTRGPSVSSQALYHCAEGCIVLIDFLLTVKGATLIFISVRGSAISSVKEEKSGLIYYLVNSK